jgi:tape measure domain-containing protein
MVIRELLIRLGLTGSDNVGKGLDKVDGKVDKTIQSFSALGGVLATVFSALTISNIAKTADSMQSFEARIGMLSQTVTDSATAFDEVAQHAADSRQSIDSYATFYLRVGNAAKSVVTSQEELLSITDTVSKAMVVGGATAEEQSSALLQFAQALGSGVLQGDEFRSLAEAAPMLLDKIGEALKIPREQLKKMAADGKLTTRAVLGALKTIGPEFDKAFQQMPLTIGQALTIAGNKWDQFIARMNRSSGAVTWIANKFLWLADKVEHSLDIVTDALGGAENAVKILGVVIGSAGLVGAVYLLSAAFTALSSPLFLIIGALAALFLIGDDVNSWLKGQKSLLGDMIGPASDYKNAIDGIKSALEGTVEQIKALMNLIKELDKAMQSSVLMDINNAVTGSAEWARNALGLNDGAASGGVSETLHKSAAGWRKYNERTAAENEFATSPTNLLTTPNTLESMTRSAGAAYERDKSLMGGTFSPNTNVYITVPAGTSSEQQSVIRKSAQETYGELSTKLGNTLNYNTGG